MVAMKGRLVGLDILTMGPYSSNRLRHILWIWVGSWSGKNINSYKMRLKPLRCFFFFFFLIFYCIWVSRQNILSSVNYHPNDRHPKDDDILQMKYKQYVQFFFRFAAYNITLPFLIISWAKLPNTGHGLGPGISENSFTFPNSLACACVELLVWESVWKACDNPCLQSAPRSCSSCDVCGVLFCPFKGSCLWELTTKSWPRPTEWSLLQKVGPNWFIWFELISLIHLLYVTYLDRLVW